MSILSSVALGWLGRRLGDWGGWAAAIVGGAISIYSALDPVSQQAVMEAVKRVATGQWRDIPLGQIVTLAGVVSMVWSQRSSFRATVKPQVVTTAGDKIETDKLPEAVQASLEATAVATPRLRTPIEALLDNLNKSWRKN